MDGGGARRGRFFSCLCDHGGGHIETRRREARFGESEHVRSRPTPEVENVCIPASRSVQLQQLHARTRLSGHIAVLVDRVEDGSKLSVVVGYRHLNTQVALMTMRTSISPCLTNRDFVSPYDRLV